MNGAASASGTATLLSADTLVQTYFDESGNNSNAYANSTLRKKIEEGYENGGAHVDGILDSLSDAEQGAIKTRTLVHGSYNNEPQNTDCIAGDADLEDVALWPLSTKEAYAVNKSLRIVDPDHPSWKISYWWLRSPGDKDHRAAYVCGDGDIDYEGVDVSKADYCARPAFYLNLESVLFTSAAEGGKSSGDVGAGSLKEVGTNETKEWKLTVKDKAHGEFKVEKACRIGRDYSSFLSFRDANPDLPVTEMDTVEGVKGGKVILTVHFVKAECMVAFLRDRNDARSVTDAINALYEKLSPEVFCRIMPLLLGDNGSEFSNPSALEKDPEGNDRTRVFYCDPSAPFQKGSAERNHEFIRMFVPKGKPFDNRTQDEIDLMMNHINSYKRPGLGNRSPYEMMAFLYGEGVCRSLGLERIPADRVVLNRSIFIKTEDGDP